MIIYVIYILMILNYIVLILNNFSPDILSPIDFSFKKLFSKKQFLNLAMFNLISELDLS